MYTPESTPNGIESLLIAMMHMGDSPEMREVLTRWMAQGESEANEIEDGVERSRARIELIIKQATLLLREAKLPTEAITALDEAWTMAANEDLQDLMEEIKMLYGEAGVGLEPTP